MSDFCVYEHHTRLLNLLTVVVYIINLVPLHCCSTSHIHVHCFGIIDCQYAINYTYSIPQVLSLPVASLHDSDSGDQHLHHPVHVHGADVGEGCGEGL